MVFSLRDSSRTVALVFLVLGASPPSATAEWVSGHGERLFGPDTAEGDACRIAEGTAEEDALRQVAGERLSGEDTMACLEGGNAEDSAACRLHHHTWSQIDGEMRGRRNVRRDVRRDRNGDRLCAVSLEADVIKENGRPDPSFDLVARPNRSLFRHGEAMEITLIPTRPMYVSVFAWVPYARGDQEVIRLFPNSYDANALITAETVIPSSDNKKHYGMEAAFPEEGVGQRRLVDEYLLAVATPTEITFASQFTLNDFKTRLHEIPAAERRIVKRGYVIARPE